MAALEQSANLRGQYVEFSLVGGWEIVDSGYTAMGYDEGVPLRCRERVKESEAGI
jgi:hypothetical protein